MPDSSDYRDKKSFFDSVLTVYGRKAVLETLHNKALVCHAVHLAHSNREAGITGVLLATETHFLQVLEGGFDDVNELFMHIVRDPRHEKIQLIAFDCVESRLFGGWAMHGVGIFNFNRKLIDDLIDHYGEEEGSVRFPVEDWKVLALISDLRMG